MAKTIDIDDFDLRLLELVRVNNIQSARTMAEVVGLSESAVLRRLRRLRAAKVIVADVAIVSPALTGAALTMHVLVRMKQAGPAAMDAFARAIIQHPEVVGAWDVTGDDDFVLKVQVATMAAYDAFTRRVLGEASGVRTFKTLITIRTVIDDHPSRRPVTLPIAQGG